MKVNFPFLRKFAIEHETYQRRPKKRNNSAFTTHYTTKINEKNQFEEMLFDTTRSRSLIASTSTQSAGPYSILYPILLLP